MIISVLIVPKTFLSLLLHCVAHSTYANIVIILLIPNKIQFIFKSNLFLNIACISKIKNYICIYN